MFGFLKKKSSEPKPEQTIVYMRDLFTPARHWESPVEYDAWGQPYAFDYKYGKTVEELHPNGRYGSYDWQNWRHKSGPPVVFNNADPSKSWFPSNPNDNIPLNS